jgi:hypothetical protein
MHEFDRFFSKVDFTGPCWTWTASTGGGGSPGGDYGQFKAYGKQHYAHRFSYELLVGPIPGGLNIDHLCRNGLCVNPAHLEPVTQRTNLLRGNGTCAWNARKTHCLRGHIFKSAAMPDKVRVCSECRLIYNRLPENLEKKRLYDAERYLRRKSLHGRTRKRETRPRTMRGVW